MRITSHFVLDFKPVAPVNQSHSIFPSLTIARKSAPLVAKKHHGKPSPAGSAEVVEDICEDTVTGVEGCDCGTGRVKDVGGVGWRVAFSWFLERKLPLVPEVPIYSLWITGAAAELSFF